MKSLGYLSAFLGGAIAGAALGILMAPEKGEDTRVKITDAVEDFLKKHNTHRRVEVQRARRRQTRPRALRLPPDRQEEHYDHGEVQDLRVQRRSRARHPRVGKQVEADHGPEFH